MPRGYRRAEAELGVRHRRLDPQLRQARRKFQRFGKSTSRDLRQSFSGIRRDLVGLAGLGGVTLAGREVYEFEKRLTRLGIQASRTPDQMARLRDAIDETSVAAGVDRDELLDVSAQFVSLTGDIATAEKVLGVFARTASASGAQTQDLARVAFSLRQNFGIDASDFEKAFSILLRSGKAGSVELKEMASLLTTIAPQFTKFGVAGSEGLGRLAAAFQVVQSGFKGPEEAATGLNGLFTALAKNAARFEEAGIRIFDRGPGGEKRLREFRDLVESIASSRLVKDPTALQKAFGRAEAVRAFEELRKFRGEWDRLAASAADADDVSRDALKFQQSAAGRTAQAMAQLKVAIADAFTPERVELFAKAVQQIATAVTKVFDAIDAVDNAITKAVSNEAGDRGSTVRLSAGRLGYEFDDATIPGIRYRTGLASRRERGEARLLLNQSRFLGLVDEQGRIDRGEAGQLARTFRAGGDPATRQQRLVRSIEFAQEIVRQDRARQDVDVKVRVELDRELVERERQQRLRRGN